MDNLIMNITVFDALKKEFSVNDKGQGFCSRRAIARMTGKHHRTIQDLLQNISGGNLPHKTFEPFTNKDWKGDGAIPDTLASAIIQYYAFKGSETAQDYLSAFVAIGLRTVIQETVKWQKEEKSNEYNFFILPEPTVWVKRFPDKLYDQFSRLTGLTWDKKTHQCPPYFAKLTNAFVYKYLPSDAYKLLKENQKAIDKGVKLHQFLNEDALISLEHHLETVLTILIASSSIREAKRLLNQAMTKNYQLSIFK